MNTEPKKQQDSEEYKTKSLDVIKFILGALALIVVVVVISSGDPRVCTETTQAIYKGYAMSGFKRRYPIVEVNGKEYISSINQPVRDNSFINNEVTITYDKDDMNYFRVIW